MISVVAPCYNEREVLGRLYQRLCAAAEAWQEPFEVILVDDGSDEATWQEIQRIHDRDPRWKAVRFSRNFGHQTAVSAGVAHARGQAVIVMDADLQDPPEELGRFLQKWREGYEVVYGVRRKRKEGLLKRLCYRLFYRILARISTTPIPLDSGDFCLMDRRVAALLKSMPERNRFVRGLRAWVGFRQIGVEYQREAREAGRPKYTLRKLVKLAIDGIFSFSTWPLRLATRLGLLVSTVAFLGAVFTFFQKVFEHWFAKIGLGPERGFPTIVIAILFLGGVQLICLGIIGEYIGRIYDEVKRRPSWIVRQTLGLDEPDGPGTTSGPTDALGEGLPTPPKSPDDREAS
jgi:glycosyltransferase involved in cell wall biosynthesis